MLRISKLTDYAMLILSYMATAPAALNSATFMAEVLHIPHPTVSKILKMLAEGSVVNSVRGAEGGYLLAKPATEISVAEVIMVMEGGVALMECCETASLCSLQAMCTLKENWKKINGLVYGMLAQVTILDMVNPLAVPGVIHGK